MSKELKLRAGREIKFKVWDTQYKCFLDVEAHFSNEVPITPDDWSRGNFSPARFEADQTRFLLLQYTGLKDKNGTEIYEGDLFLDEEDNSYDFVEWSDFHAGWGTHIWWTPRDLVEQSASYEVVGNIKENPDFRMAE